MKYFKIWQLIFVSLAFILNAIRADGPQTPLEKAGFSKLTSHSEMMTYLKSLENESGGFNSSIIGTSLQGRDIPALFFTADTEFAQNKDNKPVVLIFCQQHGDEPSGKEAALMLARYLSGEGRSLLKKLDLILVPMVNPDGAEIGKRTNAAKMDLNRNHVILSEPEAQAVHDLFLKWKPHVTLDVHEYNAITKSWISQGFVKDADEMLGGVTNLNIDKQLIDFTRQIIIPETGRLINDAGFSFHRYIVGGPPEKKRIRYSTTNINDGRQSLGIYNTLSFIIEGKRYGDILNKIEYRTRGQLAAQTAFLKVIADNSETVIKLVNSSREKILQNSPVEYIYIQMDYFPDSENDSLLFPVFDISQWKRVYKKMGNFEPDVKIKKSIKKPFAYIFSQKEAGLTALLKKHQIKMRRLERNTLVPVENYKILNTFNGMDEDKPILLADVEKESVSLNYKKGDIVIQLNQPAGNLIPLLLEPQSTWNVCRKRNGHQYRLSEYLEAGKDYPIKRIMKLIDLKFKEDK